MRLALYARVSTLDKGQNPETQLQPLREYAARRQSVILGEYVDEGVSGSKDRRPQLDRLMKDVRLGYFDAVVVMRFDRFGRSTKHLITALEEFQALGVGFISLNESIDTSTPMGKMIFTILAAVAEMERGFIRERIMAGLARARREKTVLGRPKRIFDREKAREMNAAGKSLRSIAKDLGVAKSTVKKVLV